MWLQNIKEGKHTSEYSDLRLHVCDFFSRTHTVDCVQLPVGGLLGEGKRERLRERGAVLVFGLDEHRFDVLHADETLRLNQFGDVVVDVQQAHVDHLLRRFLRVLFIVKQNINKALL